MSCPTYIDSGLGFATGGGGGGGTVTSVGLTMPALFTVANTPVTTSGTFSVTLATQTANRVFAGPTTGVAAAPTFRQLIAADMNPTFTASQVLRTDGTGNLSWATVTATPAGSNNQIQYNNAGAFGASANLLFDSTGAGGNGTGTFLFNPTSGNGAFFLRYDASASPIYGNAMSINVLNATSQSIGGLIISGYSTLINLDGRALNGHGLYVRRQATAGASAANGNVYSLIDTAGVETYNCYFETNNTATQPTYFPFVFRKRGYTTTKTFVIQQASSAGTLRDTFSVYDTANDTAQWGTVSFRSSTIPTLGLVQITQQGSDSIPALYVGNSSVNGRPTCVVEANTGEAFRVNIYGSGAYVQPSLQVKDEKVSGLFGKNNIAGCVPMTGQQSGLERSQASGTVTFSVTVGDTTNVPVSGGMFVFEATFITAANNNNKTIKAYQDSVAVGNEIFSTGAVAFNDAKIFVRTLGFVDGTGVKFRWTTLIAYTDSTGSNSPIVRFNTTTQTNIANIVLEFTTTSAGDVKIEGYSARYHSSNYS